MPSKSDLRQRQALPLGAKVLMTQNRIREWYNHWNGDVCISFSGGKDSTVLAHIIHDLYPDVPMIFSNTGLEYPEIQSFARKMGAEFIRPKMSFSEVISKYGYPLISKEVAQAIYYARRIRNGQRSKETERRRTNLQWEKQAYSKRNMMLGKVDNLLEYRDNIPHGEKTTEYYQRMLMGYKGISKGGDIWIADKGKISEEEIEKMKHDLNELFTKQMSFFNKRKWLPLCMEGQFMISHYCCAVMKKNPLKKYQKESGLKPYLGTLAEESKMRENAWMKNGCNAYESKNPLSQPLSFWTEQDILHYIKQEKIEISSVYGEIVCVDDCGFEYEPLPGIECKLKCTKCQRTGCMFCGFGAHHDNEKARHTRFQRLAETHPKQYEYCMTGGQWVDNPNYDPTAPKMDGKWENWNPKKIWVPSKKGLGMKKVFDDCNQIYGKDFIRYE